MFRIERGPLLISTLAVCLANQAFPEVEFVTDSRGAALAAALGWQFGNVNLALDTLEAPGIAHVWALGKLVALLEQTGPCVQFDGDVLLFKPLPESIASGRLIAQSPDIPAYYLGPDMAKGRSVLGLPAGGIAYNAGLIGGADISLLRDYAAGALALAQKFRGSDLNGTTASMLVEQYHLGLFAKRHGVEVSTLLPVNPTREEVREVGYAHLVGSHKRMPYYIAKAEARLVRDFPEAHERFREGYRSLWPEGSRAADTIWAAAL